MRFTKNIFSQLALSIKTKLFLVSLTLLVIPYVGYQSIQDIENYLRKEQEKSLLDYAAMVATVLQDYPGLFQIETPEEPTTSVDNHIYIRPLHTPIQMDGYAEDWL